MTQKTSFGRLISSVYQQIIIYTETQLKEYKIGLGQIPFLTSLLQKDGVNQETLTAEFGFNKATTARAIAKLEKEGYVTRKRDEKDHRAYKIYLTNKAKETEPKLKDVLKGITVILTAGLTEDEKASVILLLNKMFQNISVENNKSQKDE
jgi:DNA-binding MarR family transcriptional regulator